MSKRTYLLAVLLPILAGCSSLWMAANSGNTRQGASSSLVDFLYPNGEIPPAVSPQMPHLSLPLRVGIAFVPSQNPEDIPAAEKQDLLERVANAFRDRPYVQSIDAIPDTYMRSARGVHGMQQVAAMYSVDVMALVSYDQITFTDERNSALLYWTVIGAAVVKGNSNEVQTMIDTAVFDIATTKLLFRAPGTHRDQDNATLLDVGKEMRRMRGASFVAATDHMIVNLDQELDGFREAVDKGERAEVEWRAGSRGGGSLALPLLAMLALAALISNRIRRRL